MKAKDNVRTRLKALFAEHEAEIKALDAKRDTLIVEYWAKVDSLIEEHEAEIKAETGGLNAPVAGNTSLMRQHLKNRISPKPL